MMYYGLSPEQLELQARARTIAVELGDRPPSQQVAVLGRLRNQAGVQEAVIVSASGATGASVATTSWRMVSLVTGAMRMLRTTSRLLPRSARDWMSALPISGSSAGAPPRSHLASNSRT